MTSIPFAIALCLAPLAQSVSGSPPPRLITVSGSGEVRVPPDEIVITLGVETSSQQLMTARTENDDRINAMKKAAAFRGVRSEHLKTDYLNIEPRYRDDHAATGFIGYFVRRTLVITVRDVGTFESLLSDVLQAGEGLTLEHSIPLGQVFFVPREAIPMRAATSEELKSFEESRQEFNVHKAAAAQKTSYGLSYSPHYLRQSRTQKSD